MPKSIVLVFILMAGLSVFAILRDTTESGLRPFGFVNDVFAQFTVDNPNATSQSNLPTNSLKVVDSWGRCEVIRADGSKTRMADSGIGKGKEMTSKAGINQGDANDLSNLIKKIDDNKLEMSYVLVLASNMGSIDTVVPFIQTANENGYLPIVRLCYDGDSSCGFNLSGGNASSLIEFYTAINTRLSGGDDQYIAVLGPNEPGTGNEMAGFRTSSYTDLVNASNSAAEALQSFRVTNGGNMYLAPAIFNLVNRQRDDALEYLNPTSHAPINADLFDYILGNTYDLPNGRAIKWYEESGARQFVLNNPDLLTIITEFGYFPGDNSDLRSFGNSYSELCEDDTIDGIMFFRPNYNVFEASAPRQEPPIPISNLQSVINSCDKKPTKALQLNSRWLNCNFDSCVSPNYTYSARSTATVAATYTPDNSTKKAWLKVSCAGGSCTAKQQNTMQVSLPIKSLGSNTASNSAIFKSYPPACASIAAAYGGNLYDALNQFAGPLTQARSTSNSSSSSFNKDYSGKTALNNKIAIISDSQGAPTPERGTFLPSEWFSNANTRSSAIPGSSAAGFVSGQFSYPDLNGVDTVVVWLGTNDCSGGVDAFSSNINTILNTVKGRVNKVILLPVPYRNQNNAYNVACEDSLVTEMNNAISALATGNVTFLNVNFTTANKSSYLDSDGLHVANLKPINEAIYEAVSTGSNSSADFGVGSVGVSLSNSYPMPWLGSLINCLSELSLSLPEFAGTTGLEPNYHPFSKITETKQEAQSDLNRELAIEVTSPLKQNEITSNGKKYIADEKAACLETPDGQSTCLDNSNLDILNSLSTYQPFDLAPNYYYINKRSGGELIYLKNNDDYLPGPEVITQDVSTRQVSNSEICWAYGQRVSNTSIKNSFRFTEGASVGNVSCKLNTAIAGCSALGNITNTANFKQGRSNLSSGYRNCFNYEGGGIVEVPTTNFGSFSSFNIPGIYDALYRTYQRLQTDLSKRNLKMVFKQDVGWQVKQDLIIRDAGTELTELGDYLYVGEYSEASCTPVDFFKNNYAKAKGSNTITKYEYYSWVGYLDVMQEWLMAYVNNTTLPGDNYIDNPFYNTQNSALPNYNKSRILVNGLASRYLSFPILTCDQVNICKQYSNSELVNALKSTSKYASLSDEDLQSMADSMCPFLEKLPENKEFTCLDTITSTEKDNLAKALCQKGYTIDGVCDGMQCISPTQNNNTTDNTDSSNFVVNSACPSSECPTQLSSGVGGISYPSCNEKILTTGTGASGAGNCAYWKTQAKYFGNPNDPNFASENLVSLTALSRAIDGDGFLGMSSAAIPINKNAADVFIQAEQKFNELYGANRNGATYYLPSFPNGYTFSFGRSYSPEADLGTDPQTGEVVPSNHMFGVAIDLNVTTNWGNWRPYQASCIIDIPPELVQVFESYGIRWGGRFALRDYAGGAGVIDPMHFEVVPECAPELLRNPDSITPITPINNDPSEPSLICDPDQSKDFDNIDCLIKSVSDFIADHYQNGYPASILKATLNIETRLHDENGVPYSGDPYKQAYVNDNSAGAAGPTQFVGEVFLGLVNQNQDLFLACLNNIGFELTGITAETRTYLGPALCASAIKHNTDLQRALGDGFSEITSESDWFENRYDPDTARADWESIFRQRGQNPADGERFDRLTEQISAAHIIARRYYGACLTSLENPINYCQRVYDTATNEFANIQCSSANTAIDLSKRSISSVSGRIK